MAALWSVNEIASDPELGADDQQVMASSPSEVGADDAVDDGEPPVAGVVVCGTVLVTEVGSAPCVTGGLVLLVQAANKCHQHQRRGVPHGSTRTATTCPNASLSPGGAALSPMKIRPL